MLLSYTVYIAETSFENNKRVLENDTFFFFFWRRSSRDDTRRPALDAVHDISTHLWKTVRKLRPRKTSSDPSRDGKKPELFFSFYFFASFSLTFFFLTTNNHTTEATARLKMFSTASCLAEGAAERSSRVRPSAS